MRSLLMTMALGLQAILFIVPSGIATMRTIYAHRGWRLFVVVVLQVAAMLAVWWFVTRALVPYGGIPGTLVWLAGGFALACWMDGQLPWRARLA